MKRKIIQLAGRTLVISLPSKWVKKYGVKKGDEMDVDPNGGQITLRTGNQILITKTSLVLNCSEELARRKMNTVYKKGYDEIDIYFENPKLIESVKKEMETLLGYEIVKHGEKHCIIKNIASAMDQEFDNVLRRIFLMINEMGENIQKAITKKEFSRLEEIKKSEHTNDKLTNFCKRILNKKPDKQTNLLYCIVRELEKIADEHESICNNVLRTKEMNKEMLQLYKDANNFFRMFYELFYKFDESKATKFSNRRLELEKRAKHMMHKKINDSMIMHHIINIIKRTDEAIGPYFAMVL